MEEYLTTAGNFGFPMVVAAYLLIRIESKLDKLSTSINQLAAILSSSWAVMTTKQPEAKKGKVNCVEKHYVPSPLSFFGNYCSSKTTYHCFVT